MDEQEPDLPPPPPKKKAGRKRVAKRKQAQPKKERGKYGSSRSILGDGDSDLAECLFSDDELRSEYQEIHCPVQPTSDTQSSHELSELMSSVDASMDTTGSTPSTSVVDSDSSRPSSSLSRPSSSQSLSSSRPPSSSGSRPQSAAGFVQHEDAPSGSVVIGLPVQTSDTVPPLDDKSFEQSTPSLDIINLGLNKFRSILPQSWVPIADSDGFHLLLCNDKMPKTIQREIYISYSGNVHILFHCKVVPSFRQIFKLESQPLIAFSEQFLNEYCDFGLNLVQIYLRYEACVGANDLETKNLWDRIPGTCIDSNPYKELKYSVTCRSLSCSLIINLGVGKRCNDCAKVQKNINKRKEFLLSSTADTFTRNRNLTYEQAMNKLEELHKSIRRKDKRIAYLQARINKVLDEEGVNIAEDLNETFSRILMESDKLTEVQKMFLQEQWSSAHTSAANAHKWHPSMIRMALNIYMKGTGHYNSIRDLGVIRLPHSRTLFDYAHCIKAKDGINEELVNLVYERVEQLSEPHKQLHVLMCDGMHVSQNLVYRVSDGDLVGYAKLDEVDKEMERLEKYIDGKEPINSEEQLATEVLAYLVKGMASDVKCVVASYPIKVLGKEMLYRKSWDVIRYLETAGIKILAFICDGHATNRAFFKMHVPSNTDVKFGSVFNTINFCAPDSRLLYFVSDVCHVLKTIRNSFYNSGEGPKKPRKLLLNGEKIVWKHIVRLYFTYKNDNFRKSYKLSALNVFPNKFSRMKVAPAAQVLSKTVAQDLEDQHWPETKEVIKFIRLCNRFFDCLNGAHTAQGKRKNNPDLGPYTPHNIEYEVKEGRFKFLRDFIDYLDEWKAQVQRFPLPPLEKEKMMLPVQTMVGIETSIRAIEAATLYFLDPEKGQGNFVMARIFSQDPLEHHFGEQRQGGGGSRNPNVSKFLNKQVTCALQRGITVRKRGANSAEGGSGMQVTNEPVPKKKRHSKK